MQRQTRVWHTCRIGADVWSRGGQRAGAGGKSSGGRAAGSADRCGSQFWSLLHHYAAQQRRLQVVVRVNAVAGAPTGGPRLPCPFRMPQTPTTEDAEVTGRLIVAQLGKGKSKQWLYLFTTSPRRDPEIVALYGQRWNIETALRNLKRTVQLHYIRVQCRGPGETPVDDHLCLQSSTRGHGFGRSAQPARPASAQFHGGADAGRLHLEPARQPPRPSSTTASSFAFYAYRLSQASAPPQTSFLPSG